MDLRRRHFLPFVFALVAAAPLSAAAAPEILFPPQRTALATPIVSVLGKDAPNAAVAWQHFLSSGVVQKEEKAGGEGYFSLSEELEPGVNRLTVGGTYLEIYYDDGSGPLPTGYFRRTAHAGDISMCEDCHDKFTGKLLEGGFPGVCTSCHVVTSQNPANPAEPSAYPHFRSVQSACGTCHEAHYSESSKLVKASAKKPCLQCHAAKYKAEAAHPAFEEGGCAACHDTHYSGYPRNLYANMPKVCQQCHSQGKESKAKTFHPPDAAASEKWCSACHDPHATTEKLLVRTASSLCAGCHGKILERGHGKELSDCTVCHDPHRPVGSRLLVKNFKGCDECHDGYASGKSVHPPVEDGCQNCHSPHSDGNVSQAKAKCLKCHNFANDRDVASLHGNLPMTVEDCLKCHKVHASSEPKLARAKTHFPLTQGKCDACHGSTTPTRKIADENGACAKCHSTQRDLEAKKAKLHDPLTDGGCTECHDPHMSAQKRYLVKPAGALCRDCHAIEKAGDGRTLHPAAETCTDCHAPHGGERAKFLSAPVPKLCIGCHDDPAAKKKVVHAALDEGCVSCHNPHAGTGKYILQNGGTPKLCFACHSDPADKKKVVHPALDEGCTACHEAHAGDNAKLLTAKGNALCLECHDDPAAGGDPHPALDEGCTACHAAHASDAKKLVKAPGDKVCLDCHDDPKKGMKTVHAALDEGCVACHDPHVSKKGPLLKRPVNEVCRDCHDSLKKDHHALGAKIAKDYPGPTPFPVVGDELSCVGCHQPHASPEGKLFAKPEKDLCSSCH